MNKLKTRFKVLVMTLIVLMAVLAGGTVYLNDYYRAGETATGCIADSKEGIEVSDEDGKYLVFRPVYSPGIDKALIFYPGGKVEYTAYAPLMEKLAKKGILCFLVKMPANFALFNVTAAEQIREKYPSIKEWYIGGHSLGGVAAAMNVENNSENYKGIYFLGSYPSVNLAEKELSALSIFGDKDQVLNMEEYEKCRRNFPADFSEFVIEGGNHAGIGDYGIQRGDGQATISQGEQQEKTAEIIAEWMGK